MGNRMSTSEWHVGDIESTDVEDLRSLFSRAFGHSLSAKLWDWKYGSGRGVGVGARSPQGELLAHYGGTYREVTLGDQRHRAVHIGDVMVAAEGRAALSYKGPFGLVTDAFFRCHVGRDSGSAFGFGFPNDRHMRLGERLGHYSRVDGIVELEWSCSESNSVTVEPVDWSDAVCELEVDQFWVQMRAELPGFVVPARSGAWLRHRYANHPEHEYHCFWVRRRGDFSRSGIVVLRGSTFSGSVGQSSERWELMDWVSPLKMSSLMVRAARDIAAANGGRALSLWCSCSVAHALEDTVPRSTPVCSAAVTVPNSTPIGIQWWLTGGDTDFR